jgi:large subunit ribosomal protein L35
MPKIKTHKGTAKRFRVTKNGKLLRMKPGRSHLRRKKSGSKRSDYRHVVSATVKSTVKMVQAMAGGSAEQ